MWQSWDVSQIKPQSIICLSSRKQNYFHHREISRAISQSHSFRPFLSQKARASAFFSSVLNVHAKHTKRLIRYLSAHFVDSVEIPSALRYASYSAPCWHPSTYKCADTHILFLYLSIHLLIFLFLADKRTKTAEILPWWKWRLFCARAYANIFCPSILRASLPLFPPN